MDVRVGDYILAINGQELKAPDNIYRLLDGTANKQTSTSSTARRCSTARVAPPLFPSRTSRRFALARGSSTTGESSTRCRRENSPTSICRTPADLAQ